MKTLRKPLSCGAILLSAVIGSGMAMAQQAAPTVTFSDLLRRADGTYTTNITLSHRPARGTAFDEDDLTLLNASAALTGSGTSYIAVLTPTEDGLMRITARAGSYMNRAGTRSTRSFTQKIHDATPPHVVLGRVTKVDDNLQVTVFIAGAKNGTKLVASNLNVKNATIASIEDKTEGNGNGEFIVTLTVPDDTEARALVRVKRAQIFDAAGNANVASEIIAYHYDTLAPTVAFTPLEQQTDGTYKTQITLSETPGSGSDFSGSDLVASNATYVLTGSGTAYEAILTPSTDGIILLTAITGAYQDEAQNDSTAAKVSVKHESEPTEAPTVSGNFTQNIDGSITFTGFSGPEVNIEIVWPDGTTTTLVADTQGRFSATSPTDQPAGNVMITARDASGNKAQAMRKYAPDNEAPSLVISGAPEQLNGRTPFTLTFTFSEDVTGFEHSDIALSGGTLGALSGTASTYTASFTPSGQGDVTISVAKDQAQDGIGHGNTASNVVVVTNTVPDETAQQIAAFSETRSRNLVANQTNLLRFMQSSTDQTIGQVMATKGHGNLSLKSSDTANVWFDIKSSWTSEGTSSTSYVLGSFGGHKWVSDNFALGALLELDHASQTNGALKTSGTGWLVGPYVIARLPEQPLFFEGRALFGQTANTITPAGGYTDDYDTNRFLLQARISGETQYKSLTLKPYLEYSYVRDTQLAYVDGLGNNINTTAYNYENLVAGIDLRRGFDLKGAHLNLLAGVAGNIDENSKLRTKIDLGVEYFHGANDVFSVNGYYDGLGISDYESVGIALQWSRNF